MIQEFSAVCWLFGKELSNELKVRARHISREGRWAISDDLGRSRAISDALGRCSAGFARPRPLPQSSPHRCRSGSSRPAGEGRRSRSGCRRRQTRRATKAAGAVQRDDDSSSCLLVPSLTHRQLERRPLQRDDRAVCGWPHGPSPRDHKSTCVYLARARFRLAPWPSPARSGTKASLTTGADAAARAPVAGLVLDRLLAE